MEHHNIQGHVENFDGEYVSGWVINIDSPNEPVSVEIYANNALVGEGDAKRFRLDLYNFIEGSEGKHAFKIKVDAKLTFQNEGEKVTFEVTTKNRRVELNGSPLVVDNRKLSYWVDGYNDGKLSGWITDLTYQHKSLLLDVYINDNKVDEYIAAIPRGDLKSIGHDDCNSGFVVDFYKYIEIDQVAKVGIKLNGYSEYLGDFYINNNRTIEINALEELQKIIKEKISDGDEASKYRLLNKLIIPDFISKIRRGEIKPAVSTNVEIFSESKKSNVVDIIIPIYKGVNETINCIKSVFSVKSNVIYNVIAINDCSPEEELTTLLRTLSTELPITLLENKKNLGFVSTVNKGMRLNPSNDVVLLNSDTVVTDYWLDRVLEAAYKDSTIGTVTPFSNNATICSYPNFCQDNELPTEISLNELAKVISEVNGNEVVDLPTAHGFSMFIKREVLDEVGLFDDEKWGKGYAEENDFSLRARSFGWRNVIATGAFVHHLGSVSFAEDATQFIAKNLKILNGIYPDYSQSVQLFIALDPIRPYRNNISLALMKKEVQKQKIRNKNQGGSIVFVSLSSSIGGGTEVATTDLSKIHHNSGQSVFMLTCPKKNIWELSSQIDNSIIQYHLPQDKNKLLSDLKSLEVSRFHIHHTLQFDKTIWELPKELGVEYDVTLHDYYTICPRVNLVNDSEFYCGEPTERHCNNCIKRNGVHDSSLLQFSDFGDDIRSWRSFFESKLQDADKVITPSYDTKNRIIKYFNIDNIETKYHPETEVTYNPRGFKGGEVINVAFIGAIGIHKGLNILKELAEYSYEHDFPLKFTVVGYTSDDAYFDDLPNVKITGKYKKEELASLIKSNNCHIAALFSVWPETYSYTLSEALRANLDIVTFDIGAIVERTKGYSTRQVIPLDSSTGEIITKILRY
ncbi:TPA: glycosyltransferase [Vibrio parahaemolyticus]|nr:glycosyltransferase [Vibrio parahaemolyticus]